MSNRLDQEREEILQPQRIKTCKNELESMGFVIKQEDKTKLVFDYKGNPIQFWPYSGWFTGKTIKDGRGFINLLSQLKENEVIEDAIREKVDDAKGENILDDDFQEDQNELSN